MSETTGPDALLALVMNDESTAGAISKAEARRLLLDLIEQQALALGGIVALHDVEDSFVWMLIQDLDEIRLRFLQKLDSKGSGDGAERTRPKLEPHPAIEDFLTRIRGART